jgi:ankyrin repeat protein
MACGAGNMLFVRYLIQNGAEINPVTKDGITPLHESILSRRASTDLIQLLLAKGAEVNTTFARFGTTPLMEAVSDNSIVAELLLKAGALPNARDLKGYTPLFYAIPNSHENEAVNLLMAHGADVHNLTENKLTSLHLAASSGRLELAKLFLEKGVDINALDEESQTPLHHAIRFQQWETARFLIEKGADATIRNNEGMTPLDLIDKNNQEFYNDLIFKRSLS